MHIDCDRRRFSQGISCQVLKSVSFFSSHKACFSSFPPRYDFFVATFSGLSVVGRDHYGVFPLKGKVLNVRDATPKQINANDEITNLKKILGLKHGVEVQELFDYMVVPPQILCNSTYDIWITSLPTSVLPLLSSSTKI